MNLDSSPAPLAGDDHRECPVGGGEEPGEKDGVGAGEIEREPARQDPRERAVETRDQGNIDVDDEREKGDRERRGGAEPEPGDGAGPPAGDPLLAEHGSRGEQHALMEAGRWLGRCRGGEASADPDQAGFRLATGLADREVIA